MDSLPRANIALLLQLVAVGRIFGLDIVAAAGAGAVAASAWWYCMADDVAAAAVVAFCAVDHCNDTVVGAVGAVVVVQGPCKWDSSVVDAATSTCDGGGGALST